MPALALALTLLLQVGVQKDAMDLQKFLGTDFAGAMRLLVPANDDVLRNSRFLAASDLARLRQELTPPAGIPNGQEFFNLTLSNVGKGYVTTLFELDFPAEQMNLMFCAYKPYHVVAVQVLIDDRYALRDTVWLLQNIYQMPEPVDFEGRTPAVKYKLEGVTYDDKGNWSRSPSAPPITVWNLGGAEAVFQPVKNQQFFSGQYWVADKNASKTCVPPDPTAAP